MTVAQEPGKISLLLPFQTAPTIPRHTAPTKSWPGRVLALPPHCQGRMCSCISPLCTTHRGVKGPQRRLKTAPPESRIHLRDRRLPCAVCLLVPLGEYTPERKMESRGKKKVERVDGGLPLCRPSWSSHGTALGYAGDRASPPLPPECQQHRRIFTPLALLSSVLLCFRDKFLSEVFTGCNRMLLCCRRQEPEGGFSGHAWRPGHTTGHWERSWSITPRWVSLWYL